MSKGFILLLISDVMIYILLHFAGLFFGKRASHPNLNNLLFGRRSYGQLKNKILHEDARRICRNVVAMCSGLAENDEN